MSLLEHPDAQALLADAVLTPESVRGCQERLTVFLQRDLPRFSRAEQRATAALVLRGRLSGLPRQTGEPIAVQAGVHRQPVQFCVGTGHGDDEAVRAELRDHVHQERGDERALLVSVAVHRAGSVVLRGFDFGRGGRQKRGESLAPTVRFKARNRSALLHLVEQDLSS